VGQQAKESATIKRGSMLHVQQNFQACQAPRALAASMAVGVVSASCLARLFIKRGQPLPKSFKPWRPPPFTLGAPVG
jgi:hypothetical protein